MGNFYTSANAKVENQERKGKEELIQGRRRVDDDKVEKSEEDTRQQRRGTVKTHFSTTVAKTSPALSSRATATLKLR